MDKEFRDSLKGTVCNVIDQDILTEDEYGLILAVCKAATGRAEADLTERYLMHRIEGDIQ